MDGDKITIAGYIFVVHHQRTAPRPTSASAPSASAPSASASASAVAASPNNKKLKKNTALEESSDRVGRCKLTLSLLQGDPRLIPGFPLADPWFDPGLPAPGSSA